MRRHQPGAVTYITPPPRRGWRKTLGMLALDGLIVFGSWVLFGAIGYGLWAVARAMGWIKP